MNDIPDTKEKATIAISRMSTPACIKLRVEIGRELIDLEIGLADFTLALTGRGDVPAELVRRLVR